MLVLLWAAASACACPLAGWVIDPSGAAIPGVVLSLKRVGGTFQAETRTGAAGDFCFDQVTPGAYEIRLDHPGFQPVRLRRNLAAGDNPPVRIALRMAQLRHEITVTDSQILVRADPAANQDVLVLDARALAALPVLDDNVVAAISRFLSPAATGSGGVSLVVDGMETSRIGVTASAIREVRINQNPYSAEFSSPGRGRVEVFTKQESAEYHGEFRLRLRDSALDARNAFAESKPVERRLAFEGHVTGPIGRKKKTSFLLSGQFDRNDRQAVLFARTLQGLRLGNLPQPERDYELSARLNHRPSERNAFSFRWESESVWERGAGAGGFDLPETAERQRDSEHGLYYRYYGFLKPGLIYEFQGRTRAASERTQSVSPGVPRIVVQDAFTGGSAQADSLSTRLASELATTVSWSASRHLLRAGAGVRDLARRGYHNRNNRQGTFFFASLEDYASGKPYSFTQQRGLGRIVYWTQESGFFVQDDWKLPHNLSLGLGIRYEMQRWPADRNNVAPRISVAFSPGKASRTVVRAGAGLFYDRMSSSAPRDVLQLDGFHLYRVILTEPGFPNPFAAGSGLSTPPPSVVRFAPGLRSPYQLHYSLGAERQTGKKTVLTLNYSGIRGISQFRSRDVNSPFVPALGRPDAAIGMLRQIESSARLAAHSVEVSARGNVGSFVQAMARYRLATAYNDTGGIDFLPADSRDLSREWAPADFNRRHRADLVATVRAGRFFELGVIAEVESGRPYSLTTGRDDNRDGVALDRPPGVRRNTLLGPGQGTVDLRWTRKIPLHGDKDRGFAFSVDAFNVLNRVNYRSYVGNLSSPFFGLPVSANPARRIQAGVRFEF